MSMNTVPSPFKGGPKIGGVVVKSQTNLFEDDESQVRLRDPSNDHIIVENSNLLGANGTNSVDDLAKGAHLWRQQEEPSIQMKVHFNSFELLAHSGNTSNEILFEREEPQMSGQTLAGLTKRQKLTANTSSANNERHKNSVHSYLAHQSQDSSQ